MTPSLSSRFSPGSDHENGLVGYFLGQERPVIRRGSSSAASANRRAVRAGFTLGTDSDRRGSRRTSERPHAVRSGDANPGKRRRGSTYVMKLILPLDSRMAHFT